MNPKTQAILARRAALASGARTYDGQACTRGHVIRYTANRLCVDCAKARRAEQTAQEKESRHV